MILWICVWIKQQKCVLPPNVADLVQGVLVIIAYLDTMLNNNFWQLI